MMKAVLTKVLVYLLERLLTYFINEYQKDVEQKKRAAEREADNQKAIEELEKAKSEKEVIDAAKKLLTRK